MQIQKEKTKVSLDAWTPDGVTEHSGGALWEGKEHDEYQEGQIDAKQRQILGCSVSMVMECGKNNPVTFDILKASMMRVF